MERQPRTVFCGDTEPGVQLLAPTYTRLLVVIANCWCRPSVMGMGAPAVRLPVLITWSVPQAGSKHPAGGTVGVPATYRLAPLSRPTVAAETGMLVPKAGTPLKSTRTTLAAVPPHSAPQFRIKAAVSPATLASKTAVKGWSRAGPVTDVTVLLTVSITKKVLPPGGLSAKASSLGPLGPSTNRRTPGTVMFATKTPLEAVNASTDPEVLIAA